MVPGSLCRGCKFPRGQPLPIYKLRYSIRSLMQLQLRSSSHPDKLPRGLRLHPLRSLPVFLLAISHHLPLSSRPPRCKHFEACRGKHPNSPLGGAWLGAPLGPSGNLIPHGGRLLSTVRQIHPEPSMNFDRDLGSFD